MSLILKQESSGNVPTPPAGKGTIFLNTSDQVVVKDSTGNTATFPTITTGNTQVVFNNNGALTGNANLTFDNANSLLTTVNLTVTGTLTAGDIAVSSISNGTSNVDIIGVSGNVTTSVGGNANILTVTGTGVNVAGTLSATGNANVGNLGATGIIATTLAGSLTTASQPNITTVGTLGSLAVTANITAGNVYANSGTVGGSLLTGTLTTAAQPNITSVGTLSTLTTSGNAVIGGNLVVNGNITYINVDSLSVEDPIIEMGGGPNGAPLSSNDGKDRGSLLHYYTSAPIDAFMGWDTSNGEFAFGSNVTVSTDVVTFNTLGNIRAATYIGSNANISGNIAAGGLLTDNIYYANGVPWDMQQPSGSNTQIQYNNNNNFGASANFTFNDATNVLTVVGNINANNANLGNLTTANFLTGTLTTNAQPNVTSVGTLTSLLVGATSSTIDFPNAKAIISQDNSGQTHAENIGVVGEAVADSANTSTWGIGVLGEARANGATRATGVQGGAYVTNSADTGAAVGVRGYSTMTHSGGYNIGVLGNASGSGYGNYAFYVQDGGIGSIEKDTFWDLTDNSNAALTFNSSGKANILGIETTDNAEGVFMSGYLNVTGNAAVGGIKTNNYYYANGSPVDFQQAAGSNTQLQFNNNNDFGASANLTFDASINKLTVNNGNIQADNINAGNVLTANFVGGTLTTAAQPNITSVGSLTSLTVTGNANIGNIGTAAIIATGNISALNLVAPLANGNSNVNIPAANGNVNISAVGTANVLVVTGTGVNVAGTLNATGNANVGNLGATDVTATTLGGTLTTAAQPNITSVGTLTSVSVTGNVLAGNVYANSGTIGANVITGNTVGGSLTTNAQPNITSVGTLTSLSVTGNVIGANFIGNLANGNSDVSIPAANGNINFDVAGNANVVVVTGTGVNVAGTLNATGNANVGNLGATGVVATTLGGTLTTAAQPNVTSVGTLTSLSVTGNVTSGNVYANSGTIGANLLTANLVTGTLTTNAQPNITSVGTLTSLTVTGNVSAGNVSGTLLTGTLTTAAQPNITSVGTLTSLAVTGNVAAGNLTTTGVLSVTGTGVSSIAGNLDMTSNNIINLASPVNANDAATKQYVDDIAQGLHTHDSCNAATDGTLATISGGTVTYNNGSSGVGATLTTTGSYTTIDGVTLSNGMRILVKNEANAAHNGIYDRTSSTVLTRSSDFDTSTEMAGGDFTFVTAGTLYDNTGWVMTDPVTTVGTTAVNWVQFSGAGTYTAGTGLTLTGSQFSVNASQTQITAVGTLGALTVSGNASAGNLNTAGSVVARTLTSNVATGTSPLTVTSTTRVANLNVEYANVTDFISASAGTGNNFIVFANAATGNVSEVTSTGLTANLSNNSITATTFVGALSGAATTAGTVTTAAQPNITSVGTLTSLAVTGNVSAGNLNATSAVVASTLTSNVATGTSPITVTSTTLVPNLYVARANVTDLISTAAGTGNNFIVFANAATGNVTELTSTGLIANLSNNSISATTFVGAVSGDLSAGTNVNASNISSGTLAQARLANSSLTVNGTAISLGGSGTITANTTQTLTLGSFLTGTSFNGGTAVTAAVDATSANTASKVVARDASGNFSAGTITATLSGAATTAGTVTTAAQPNITSTGTLTSLTVSGNITAQANVTLTTYLIQSVATGISAAGSTQGTATALAKDINVVSTVSAGQGVVLPTAVAGMRILIMNTSATAVNVYPASGGVINALATNAAYSLAAGARLDFVATTTTQWYTMNATYA